MNYALDEKQVALTNTGVMPRTMKVIEVLKDGQPIRLPGLNPVRDMPYALVASCYKDRGAMLGDLRRKWLQYHDTLPDCLA